MRHRIVHDYFSIDTRIVWQTITDDLPPLTPLLQARFPPDTPHDRRRFALCKSWPHGTEATERPFDEATENHAAMPSVNASH